VALASVLLAACGGDGTAGERPVAAPPPAAAPAAPAPAPARPPTTSVPAPPAVAVRGTPARVVVPAIGVDAPVDDLGRNPDGTLEVPEWQRAGWWRRGPEPGERGPAVIVGHVDSRAGPAVFFRLAELGAGDVVEIVLDDGRTTRFVVERTERFAKDAFPTRAVYDLTAGPELRLITCDGEFDRSTGHYVDNLVVFARGA
jgi:hypothetical protein